MSIKLKVGDRIKDNDPRSQHRGVLTITQTSNDEYGRQDYVWCGHIRIRRDRIYTDGNPRRSGFDIVRDE